MSLTNEISKDADSDDDASKDGQWDCRGSRQPHVAKYDQEHTGEEDDQLPGSKGYHVRILV